MKRYLFFAFLAVLLLSVNSNAATVSLSDNCATLSLTGPDTDPGYNYHIEASGRNNLGNWYYAWFYVDGKFYASNSSFITNSFTTKYGPFTGPHTFKLTVKGGVGGMNWCTRSVELTVKKDLKKMAADICTAIESLPGSAFKNNPDQRKNAFCQKIAEVIQLIESAEASTDPAIRNQYYQEAIDKLQNDIGAKMDSHAGGDPKDDWITDEYYQRPIYENVQQLAGELLNLQ
jgi:hypothetical protein